MSDSLRDAIQKMLNQIGDGWTLSHYVIPMGLERISDGEVESTVWLYIPPDQPEYIADGLLVRADEIQHQPVDHDDD